MVYLNGADGKKSVKSSEDAQNEALKGDSIARETGSVDQEFTRIRSIEDTGDGFIIFLKPTATDLRDSVFMRYDEVFNKLRKMRMVLKKVPLKDPKMVSEMLIEIERKLYEAIERNEKAVKDIEDAKKDAEKAKEVKKDLGLA